MTFIPFVGISYMPSVGDFACKIRILSVIKYFFLRKIVCYIVQRFALTIVKLCP